MNSRALLLAILLPLRPGPAPPPRTPPNVPPPAAVEQRRLSFEERVAAQRAIEEVFWRHRIWPAHNPTPKPPLSAVLPDDAIRANVDDTLRKSNALEAHWQRPVKPEQLQAEMDRMARDTRDPETLRELHAALGNDPFLIAETLARQTLVDRLIRNFYAFDERFHGDRKRAAERALHDTGASVEAMRSLGGEYVETRLRRVRDAGDGPRVPTRDGHVELDAVEWRDRLDEVARRFGTPAESIPVLHLSALHEDADRFSVVAVLWLDEDRATLATVTWPKRSFDDWWSTERAVTSADVETGVGSYALVAPASGGCADDTWEWRYYAPQLRYRHTAVWTGTEMIVWGGSPGYLNTGGRYNPSTDTWAATSTGTGVPSPRERHTAVWTGAEMIVWGGYSGSALNTGGRYDPATDTWSPTSVGAGVASARERHTAVWTGTEMIVWGGFTNTGGRYDPAADRWTPTSTGPGVPPTRWGHTVVWTGTEMIVWGGRGVNGVFNTGSRYDPRTNTWTPISVAAGVPTHRTDHTAVWTGTEMIVWGGIFNTALNTGGRYDPATDTWSATSTGPNVPVGTYELSAVWTGAEMIVWGGRAATPPFVDSGGRYDPATDTWSATSTGPNVPHARSEHTAVWTGTEMIVWGGFSNTGGRYDPATDGWTPTSTGANVPRARTRPAAVWTGAEMVVWGGGGEMTGGRYRPAVDSWMPTSTGQFVPSGRDGHTALWTGTEVIVWGGWGIDSTGFVVNLNTGGRYRPLADNWLPTPIPNAPGPRGGHAAVWTGAEMIVWGGANIFLGALNTGGRFKPATNSWIPTSTGANVPLAGQPYPAAVWTGREMIVWGSYLNTGGRFKLDTNTWLPTSTGAHAPSARYAPTAIWTGTEMIVWGGGDGTRPFDTGGRYDPSTNGWTPTSIGANVPEARYRPPGIWTGQEMIVWGADNGIHWLNTGGRYDPSMNVWTPTTAGAHVPALSGHAAVWTGTRMLVWGSRTSELGLYCSPGCNVPTRMWRDRDGDGYGDPSSRADSWNCALPAGYVSNAGDCDDTRATVHPGAPELCNGVDDNCDGRIDEGLNRRLGRFVVMLCGTPLVGLEEH